MTPPANATVTNVDDLSPERRRLVEAAVASDDRARFYGTFEAKALCVSAGMNPTTPG